MPVGKAYPENPRPLGWGTSMPKLLSDIEAEWWRLPTMLPDFPSDQVLSIESKWSKKSLRELADEYMLDPKGDKELLVQKLLYIGALDEEGELTGLPIGEPAEVPYVIAGNPKKFCCHFSDWCAPPEMLERGKFFDRIPALRRHYKEKHPGLWGKGAALPQVSLQTGTCYQDAWRFIIKQGEGYLVHGTVWSRGKRIGHAWVETETGYIWEPETKKFYTRLGFEDVASPIKHHRYTPTEAAILAARTKHHGPWTEDERRILREAAKNG